MDQSPPILYLPLPDPRHLARSTVESLIREPSTDPGLLGKIAAHYCQDARLLLELIKHRFVNRETLKLLLQTGPREIRAELQGRLDNLPALQQATTGAPDSASTTAHAGRRSAGEENIFRTIQRMSVAEKIRFATRADKTARGLLIRDSNKMVVLAVLESPKITEQEVESIAQSRNVSDEILRAISKKKEWLKDYKILHALVRNPKTPAGIGVSLLPHLRRKDIEIIAKSRSVSEPVRTAAGKLMGGKART